MCGIVYCKRVDDKTAPKMVKKRYFKQKSRGSDGFGFVEISDKVKVKRAEEEKEILTKLEESTAGEIMFHHRFPTSTPNFKEMTHPIFVKNDKLDYNYYVIHNGIISNCDEMLKKHKRAGFNYTTLLRQVWELTKTNYTYDYKFNDSESLAIDLALFIEGKIKTVRARGSVAFVVLQTTKTGKPVNVYFGRNIDNPLRVKKNDYFISVCSEGDGEYVEPDTLFKIAYGSDEIEEVGDIYIEGYVYYKQSTYTPKYDGRYDYDKYHYDDSYDDGYGNSFGDDDLPDIDSGDVVEQLGMLPSGEIDNEVKYAQLVNCLEEAKERLEVLYEDFKYFVNKNEHNLSVETNEEIGELEIQIETMEAELAILDLSPEERKKYGN